MSGTNKGQIIEQCLNYKEAAEKVGWHSRGDINLNAAGQTIISGKSGTRLAKNTPIPSGSNAVLKKFLVNFRRPSDYRGEFGFDWLRDEYVHPVITVTNDNNGTAIGVPRALCKNVAALKAEYLDASIRPYNKDYYPAWLAIFPHTTTARFAHGSTMHKNGIQLDLEIEEIESLQQDNTELIFESGNPFLTISPGKINLRSLLVAKKSKNLSGTTVNYYCASKRVTVKCSGGVLTSHAEIKVFARLGNTPKVEVGKLKVYQNNIIPKAEIVAVNVITHSAQRASLRNDYQYLFKNQSFNQALIRAEVKVDTQFDMTQLSSHPDINTFLNNCHTYNAERIKNDIIALYEKYGRYGNIPGGINSNNTHRTYLFFTTLSAGNVLGSCSLDSNTHAWGNAYIVFDAGLLHEHTIVHECGHSLSLPHIFQEGSMARHTFYHGYTDNYMDYTWQAGNLIVRTINGRRIATLGSSGTNVHDSKMYSFFKWQWDIMRGDRSLTTNY